MTDPMDRCLRCDYPLAGPEARAAFEQAEADAVEMLEGDATAPIALPLPQPDPSLCFGGLQCLARGVDWRERAKDATNRAEAYERTLRRVLAVHATFRADLAESLCLKPTARHADIIEHVRCLTARPCIDCGTSPVPGEPFPPGWSWVKGSLTGWIHHCPKKATT